jgi:hypothetical protein
LQTHYTIEAIKDVYETNARPVLVTCDDFADYVCKYRFTDEQFKEYLAACFLKLWGVPTPEPSFVKVQRQHIPEKYWKTVGPLHLFDKECFGSEHFPEAVEVGGWLVALGNDPAEVRKISNRADFLKIGLFDMWLSNDDRNGNNYNLLIIPQQPGKFRLYAIDHSACFNGMRAGDRPLSLQTEEDSLLTTDFCRLLYARNPLLKQQIENAIKEFYRNIKRCEDSLPKILNFVPPLWQVNKQKMETNLRNTLFHADWLKQVERNFRDFLQVTFC